MSTLAMQNNGHCNQARTTAPTCADAFEAPTSTADLSAWLLIMQLTDHQFDNLEVQANRRFGGELDQYLHDRFPELGASAYGDLRSKCAVACQRWKILSGEGICAFHEASFILGEPLDCTEEYMIALTRAILIGWPPDQVAIDLIGMLR